MPYYPSPATGQTAFAQQYPGLVTYSDGSAYLDAASVSNVINERCELHTRRRADAWVKMGWGAMTYEKLAQLDAETDAEWRSQGKALIPCYKKPFPEYRAPTTKRQTF